VLLGYKQRAMKTETCWRRIFAARQWAAVLIAGLLWAVAGMAQTGNPPASGSQDQPSSQDKQDKQDRKSSEPATSKLRLLVTTDADKPLGNASVYVRYYESGGFLRHEKLAEMNFKTNQDGTVKVPEVPQGKVLIQVIATGWHTYGKWYDVDKEEESITIKLAPPPHWY
jgi:hypothetical protein